MHRTVVVFALLTGWTVSTAPAYADYPEVESEMSLPRSEQPGRMKSEQAAVVPLGQPIAGETPQDKPNALEKDETNPGHKDEPKNRDPPEDRAQAHPHEDIHADSPDDALNARIQKLVDKALAERLQQNEKAKPQEADEKEDWAVIGSNLTMPGSWRNGLWFQGPNKDFSLHLGGAVQYDMALYTADQQLQSEARGVGPFDDGVNLRRARLRADGQMWEVIDYRLEIEFANGVLPPGAERRDTLEAQFQTFLTPGPTDMWFTITRLPVIGNVRMGNQKEPFGLDHLESYRYLQFMERSFLFDAFTPTAFNNGFTPGISVFNTAADDRATWAIGGYKNSYDVYGFGLGDGQWAMTGRLTGLLWYEADGAYMLHVGIAGSHRDPVKDHVRFRVRPDIRNAPAPLTPFVNILADTRFLPASTQDLIGLETFVNLGSLTLQAEYQGSWNGNTVDPIVGPLGTTYFQGYYIQALYWLTGEHTPWDKKAAAPDRPTVHEPFFLVGGKDGWLCGKGAWQIGVRYQWIDLNDKTINGGELNDVTLGLNWWLNPNARVQFNYEWVHRGTIPGGSGVMQAFGMRTQFDF